MLIISLDIIFYLFNAVMDLYFIVKTCLIICIPLHSQQINLMHSSLQHCIRISIFKKPLLNPQTFILTSRRNQFQKTPSFKSKSASTINAGLSIHINWGVVGCHRGGRWKKHSGENFETDSTFGETQPCVTLQWPIM